MLVETLLLYGPVLATILASVLIGSGLRRSRKYAWLLAALGLAILALICYLLFDIAKSGQMGTVAAFIIGFFCACSAFICGLWMIFTLKAWRKLAAIVLAVAFPLSMFYSAQAGDRLSPEHITQRNGDVIVQALYQYQAQDGHFPQTLVDLEPTFLATQPEALTTQHTGWLYDTTGDDFTLGYWYWPDKAGASVCLYRSDDPEWECQPNNWGPFRLIPTPMPCYNEQGQRVDTADCK